MHFEGQWFSAVLLLVCALLAVLVYILRAKKNKAKTSNKIEGIFIILLAAACVTVSGIGIYHILKPDTQVITAAFVSSADKEKGDFAYDYTFEADGKKYELLMNKISSKYILENKNLVKSQQYSVTFQKGDKTIVKIERK